MSDRDPSEVHGSVWVRLSRDFDWLTRHCVGCQLVTWAFRSGHTVQAPREAADAIVAAGAGERVDDPAGGRHSD